MPQVQLPLFPVGASEINPELGFERRDQQVVYLNGHLPVFTHEVDDLASFRFFTTQLIINGTASQSEIAAAFGVPLTTIKRYCRQYREGGAATFYRPAARRRGHRLTPELLVEVQGLLDEGRSVPEISRQTGLLASTLHKAIDDGRLKQFKKNEPAPHHGAEGGRGSTQSERSVVDEEAALGVATTRLDERLLASLGKLQAAPIRFELVTDVPKGGVLCALPALLVFGLLRHSQKHFSLPAGFYPLETIFLVIAFLALARVKSLEKLRYEPPGEWGKLVGMDRVPEVRTLRAKIELLCQDGEAVCQWSGTLAREWMEAQPESAGSLYVDGHVRVYNGSLTQLPKRYVSRQRLCLRGTTDYWVNAMDGQPFFVVTQAVDPGLRKVLEEQIAPRLLQEVPGQPTQEQLEANPRLARFTMIFDREGYSPELFKRLWALRIAVITYRKFVEDQWALEEFVVREVRLVNGEEVKMAFAERGLCLSNGLWVREVRRRDEQSGHQTAIISTAYLKSLEGVAVAMFARWCQENFFQYMAEHYGLNRLIEYGTEPLPETTLVVNPAWRRKDQEVRRERTLLVRERAQFGALTSPAQAEPEALARFEQEKGKLLEQIQQRQQRLEQLKIERKATDRKVTLKELPEAERFTQLRTAKKHFVDTIKLIAYRAETALVHIAREKLQREDDARALIRQVFTSTVDLCPDAAQKTLTVRLHQLTSPIHNQVLDHLCAELTATQTVYPGTDLRLVFEPLRANSIPRDQDS